MWWTLNFSATCAAKSFSSICCAAGTVLGAGQGQVEQVTFTPTDSLHYRAVQTTVTVNVARVVTEPTLFVNTAW